ncbi:MAG: TIGR03435 family protein [Deltaproteobacteria bacterium]|nr:TIGR03435 family protein [Deltaproteobacteria bacterium]MBW2422082.1 TIGR03435 family protein [Deltaproteobacteria bacterium]
MIFESSTGRSKRSRSSYLPPLRGAVSACLAGGAALALLSCGGAERERADTVASPQRASTDPAEAQRRIAESPRPPAGELRLSESEGASELARRSPTTGIVYLLAHPLGALIGYAYSVPAAEVADAMSLDLQRRYDAVIHPADRSVETARGMLGEHLEARFGFEAALGSREVEAMILRQMPQFSPLPPSTATTSSFRAEAGELRAVGVPMSRLVEFLRQSSRLPVIDESGLEARYDFVIQWDTRSGAYAFLQAVNDLGLEVIREPRSVRLLEIRPAAKRAEPARAGATGPGGSKEQARVE